MKKIKRTLLLSFIFATLIFGVVSCIPAGGATGAFVHKNYKDTFLIDYPVAYENFTFKSVLYDVNNDGTADVKIYFSQGPIIFDATTLFLHAQPLNNWYVSTDMANLSPGNIARVKGYLVLNSVNQNSFFVSVPDTYYPFWFALWGATLPSDYKPDYNVLDKTFYLALMDNSYGSTSHHFAWIKAKFSDDFKKIIIMESGYNVNAASSIIMGQF